VVTAFAIWWLSQQDCAVIGDDLPTWLPDWVQSQYRMRQGRPGRGRLWVADESGFKGPGVRWPEPPTAIQAYESACGGTVLPAELVPRLMHLPGLVTDLQLVRWEARKVSLREYARQLLKGEQR